MLGVHKQRIHKQCGSKINMQSLVVLLCSMLISMVLGFPHTPVSSRAKVQIKVPNMFPIEVSGGTNP